MAIIHHRFESIHPFYDGNGRTGRILNVLYLVKEGLLDIPVLYLSRYINQYKTRYYELLQKTSAENQWEEYILYMLKGIEETSKQTIEIIRGIRDLMKKQKDLMKSTLPKIYSQDLLNNIFMHPYTRVRVLSQALSVQGRTAKKYLDELESIGILEKKALNKKSALYINIDLMKLLSGVNKNKEI
jgi:Fic family protein